jgi:hypothetical protein
MKGKSAKKAGKVSTANNKAARKRARRTSIERERIPVSTNNVEEETMNRGVSDEALVEQPQGNHAATQSGDLTGVSGKDFSAGESAAELMREGQDLEGELVEAVEDAPEADEREVPVHDDSRTTVPDYKNRHRL